jgi:hypothetical protein
VSSLNLDVIEGRQHNSATVPSLEYFAQNTVVTPDLTKMDKYLLKRIERCQGIWVKLMEGTTNLCRKLGRKPVYTINLVYWQKLPK